MSFGMLMPNRNTQSNLQGGFSSGGTSTVNGNTYVSNLTVTTRIGNTPNTYKAANSIEFIGEYVDNGAEEYEAFIINQTNPDPNPTTGTVSNGNDNVYRYWFNGQEKSTEINGSENLYTAEYWEYDSRIGRRWNLDPVVNQSESRYLCFNGNPILIFDKNGDVGTSSNTGGNNPINPIINKAKSLANRFSLWWNSVSATSQTNVEVTVGVQSGVNVRVNSLVNVKAQAGTMVNKVVDIKTDALDMGNAKANFGLEKSSDNNYLQKNFVNIGVEAGIPETKLTANVGYDYVQTEKYYLGYYGPKTVDSETSKGWFGNVKTSPFKSKPSEVTITNKPSAKIGVNTEKKFYGLDFSVGVSAILGVKVQFKIGFQKK